MIMERRTAKEKAKLQAKLNALDAELNALDAEVAATRSALASLTNSAATTPFSSTTSTPVVPVTAPTTAKFTPRPMISFEERVEDAVQSSSSLSSSSKRKREDKRVITSADFEDDTTDDDDVQVVMPVAKKAKVIPAMKAKVIPAPVAMTCDAAPSRNRNLRTTLFKCLCNKYFYALCSDRADYDQLALHRKKCHHVYSPPDSERDDDLLSLTEVAIKKGNTFVAEILTQEQIDCLSKGVNRTYHSDPVKRS